MGEIKVQSQEEQARRTSRRELSPCLPTEGLKEQENQGPERTQILDRKHRQNHSDGVGETLRAPSPSSAHGPWARRQEAWTCESLLPQAPGQGSEPEGQGAEMEVNLERGLHIQGHKSHQQHNPEWKPLSAEAQSRAPLLS